MPSQRISSKSTNGNSSSDNPIPLHSFPNPHIHLFIIISNHLYIFHILFLPLYPLNQMASLTAAAVTIASFTGLKASVSTRATPTSVKAPTPMAFSVKASLKDVGVAAAAVAASAMLASNALAIEVLLGTSDGGLAFEPSSFSVAAGEAIVFKNNAGFPHNVLFDEDEIPSGVDASAISMKEEDLLNAPGETYSVTLKEKGTYSFYCSPHQGAGMVGKVTVN